MRLYPLQLLLACLICSNPALAFDDANDSTVDKAERFDFEKFHQDTGNNITIGLPATASKAAPVANALEVHAAYRLSSDTTAANLPSLPEAILDLHRQMNGYCPHGWEKTGEWYKPEDKYFLVYYRAVCL